MTVSNDADIAVLKNQMQDMKERLNTLQSKFDALNQDYSKLVNRGFGMVLLVSTLGATSGYLISWLKHLGIGSHP